MSISNHVNPKNGFGFEINSYIKNSNKFKLILGLSFYITNQFNDKLTINYRSFYTNVSSTLYNFSIPLDFRFNLGKKSNVFIQPGAFINVAARKITGTREFVPGVGPNNVSEVDKYLPLAPAIGVSFGMGLKFHLLDKEFFVKSDCKIGLNFLSKRSIKELSNVYGRFSVGIKI